MPFRKPQFTFKVLLFVLILGSIHCRKSGSFNSEEKGAVERKEILKVKRREVDSCSTFINGYKEKKIASCIAVEDFSPFCNKEECPNKPSPPEAIIPRVYLNKTANIINAKVSWKEPKFGLNSLCGFQVYVASLTAVLYQYCFQMNSKTQLSFPLLNVQYKSKYNITVVSLPAFKNLDESSRSLLLETPSECELFKMSNVKPPWHCNVSNDFIVPCANGSIKVQLEKPDNGDFDSYLGIVFAGNRFGPPVAQKNFTKKEKFAYFTDLPLGLTYAVEIFFYKDGNLVYSVSSKPFICQGTGALISVTKCKDRTVEANWNNIVIANKAVLYDYKVRPLRNSRDLQTHFIPGKMRESLIISNITEDIIYTVQVDVKLKDYLIGSLVSDFFSCRGKSIGITGRPREFLWMILLILSIAFVLALLIIACVKFGWYIKLKNLLKRSLISGGMPLSKIPEYIDLPDNTSGKVIMVYPFGCKYLDKLVLSLGQLISNMGFECVLDLVTTNGVQANSDRDLFILNHLEALKKGDRVLYFSYKGTQEESQHALRRHKELINKKIFSDNLKSDQFFAIGFETVEETTYAYNFSFVDDVERSLDNLVRTMWKIPPYQFGQQLPQLNAVQSDKSLTEDIKDETALVLSKHHTHCYKSSCNKGAIEHRTTNPLFPSIRESSKSANSFDLIEIGDTAVTEKLSKPRCERLSSSEPLLLFT